MGVRVVWCFVFGATNHGRLRMRRQLLRLVGVLAIGGGLTSMTTQLIGGAASVRAAPPSFVFSTGTPTGAMAMLSGNTNGGPRTEAADDFTVASVVGLTSATFTGLLVGATPSDVQAVQVEFYRTFPKDSTNPPSGAVPTRVNTASDIVFTARGTASSTATFTTSVLANSFTAANSVHNGINPSPNQTTGGEGPVTGSEVQFSVTFTSPVVAAVDHYFFVPQVQLATGSFLWLSAARPISGAGSTPFVPDLQADMRNANLEPDWLRVGTDIVGGSAAPTFNAVFTLSGETCVAMDITPDPLPDLTAGVAGAQQLTGTGGIGPYRFSETGALPAGITLTSDGVLAGTTSDTGTFAINVTVSDAAGCTSTVPRSLTVAAAATTTAATSTTAPTIVAATTVVATTVPPTAPVLPANSSLPATGTRNGPISLGAFALVLTGFVVLWLSRRKSVPS